MTSRSIAVSIICLCAPIAACGDTLGSAPCPGDSVTVVVTTSPIGLPPQFSWSPPCPMGEISVDGASSAANMWLIVTTDSNRVLPPLRYGQVPAGMQQLSSAQRLAPGAVYTVSVWRWVSGNPNPLFRRASVVSFVP